MGIAVLMTCHNRKDSTLRCLDCLVPQLSTEDGIFLVDDGSTDGTGAAVREKYPSITVVYGDGSLYWSKGMRRAWKVSLDHGSWDGWLWLNDDTVLDDNALARIAECVCTNKGRVVIGALRDEDTGEKIYGAGTDGLFTGNCVYVPREVFGRIGMICGEYRHAWGDYDYAHMCRRNGIGWVEVSSPLGATKAHSMRPSLVGRSFIERCRTLRDPKGWCLADLWTYKRRNYGCVRAVVSCCHLVLYVLLTGE